MSRTGFLLLCTLAAAFSLATFRPAAAAPIEAYGKLPNFDLVRMSPSGRLLAMRQTQDGADMVVVYDLEERKYTRAADISEIGARDLEFVNENTLIITVGKTTRAAGFRGSWDFTASFAMNIETGRIFQLLSTYDELFPAQAGLGRIAGYDASILSRGCARGLCRVALRRG